MLKTERTVNKAAKGRPEAEDPARCDVCGERLYWLDAELRGDRPALCQCPLCGVKEAPARD
jgi:hypothetical protein